MILCHTDKLSQTLQQPSIEGHAVAILTIETLRGLRTTSMFDLFWEKVDKARDQLDVGDPHLRRRCKAPRRFEQGLAQPEFPVSPKEEYCRLYFEALDLAVTSINSRFDQKGFKVFSSAWNKRHVGVRILKVSCLKCVNFLYRKSRIFHVQKLIFCAIIFHVK